MQHRNRGKILRVRGQTLAKHTKRTLCSWSLSKVFLILIIFVGGISLQSLFYTENASLRGDLALSVTSAKDSIAAPDTIVAPNFPLQWYEKPKPLLSEFPALNSRNDIIPIIEKLKFKRGIEVGVQKGIFAKKILSTWKSCKEYKLVDLWGKEEGYMEPGTDTTEHKDANLRRARRVLDPWTEKGVTEFFVMRSTDASKLLKDSYFDFIYIDARHDFCAVKEDIEHYWPKLRPGGIFAGHDFVDAQYAIDRLGPQEDWSLCEDGSKQPQAVRGAVEDFAKLHNLNIVISQESFPSWFIQKPYE